MKAQTIHKSTFKKGSKTYYNSSIFFPKKVRNDVYILYGFVRVADNYVDQIPQDKEGFYRFRERYELALLGVITGDIVVDTFVELMKRKDFDLKWVQAFLYSMELDLTKRTYNSIEETLEYIYGSAEVIGLFMAKLLDLPDESYRAAMFQGRAMQYINFIRDVAEDRTLGRTYLPFEDSEILTDTTGFAEFAREQIDLYEEWQREAEEGYKYIPKRYLIPVKTASDMYNWTARRIAEDPSIVFDQKIKPSKARILLRAFRNTLFK